MLTAAAIAAARYILGQKTEDAYGAAFNAAMDAQAAAWANGDEPGQEHWRLVFSAYVRLSRPARNMIEYHNGMMVAKLAYLGDPRSTYED